MATTPPTTSTLPIELWHHVFDSVDKVASTCLGLTCTKLYLIHKRKHGKVNATAYDYARVEHNKLEIIPLYRLLEVWIGPDLVWNEDVRKFTTWKENDRRLRRQLRADRLSYMLCSLMEFQLLIYEAQPGNWLLRRLQQGNGGFPRGEQTKNSVKGR
jgi:hypothetical protein